MPLRSNLLLVLSRWLLLPLLHGFLLRVPQREVLIVDGIVLHEVCGSSPFADAKKAPRHPHVTSTSPPLPLPSPPSCPSGYTSSSGASSCYIVCPSGTYGTSSCSTCPAVSTPCRTGRNFTRAPVTGSSHPLRAVFFFAFSSCAGVLLPCGIAERQRVPCWGLLPVWRG